MVELYQAKHDNRIDYNPIRTAPSETPRTHCRARSHCRFQSVLQSVPLIPFAPANPAHCSGPSKKDAKLAQKLSQLQPFIAVFPQERKGQLASFRPTYNSFLAAGAGTAAFELAELRSNRRRKMPPPLTVRARPPGTAVRALIVSHSKSALDAAVVWARRALNNPKWWLPVRAGS